MHPSSLRIQTSAGGVIFRNAKDGPQVALVSVKGGKVWTLPKGSVGKGESLEHTALREVSEETGLTGELIEKIGEITYWYFIPEENAKCRKTVHFYLMRYLHGDTAGHDREVDESAWFPVGEALQKAVYKGDREILAKAGKMLEIYLEGGKKDGKDG
ncbi:MAG: NUDIX hydrolase [Nitrospiraceae bacterium]|nr:NUDIX hydrolase [Nitrospiraceae bacterium]